MIELILAVIGGMFIIVAIAVTIVVIAVDQMHID